MCLKLSRGIEPRKEMRAAMNLEVPGFLRYLLFLVLLFQNFGGLLWFLMLWHQCLQLVFLPIFSNPHRISRTRYQFAVSRWLSASTRLNHRAPASSAPSLLKWLGLDLPNDKHLEQILMSTEVRHSSAFVFCIDCSVDSFFYTLINF